MAPLTSCASAFFLQCARDIVRLLLSHRANPNTLWSGHSPLSLSIASGNDLVSPCAPMNLTLLHLNTQVLPQAPIPTAPAYTGTRQLCYFRHL